MVKAQGRNKNSRLGSVSYDLTLNHQGAVYLNQLMSFSAVAAPAVMALKQTNTFRDKLEQPLWALVTMGSIPVQVTGSAGWLTSDLSRTAALLGIETER